MNSFEKIMKASAVAAENQVQHLMLVLTPDRKKIHLSGSDNFLGAFMADNHLSAQMETLFLNNIVDDAQVKAANTHQVDFDLLPCSPFSPQWKGSAMIRKVLRNMLNKLGYSKAGRAKKLGVGAPPVGWPSDIDWSNYTGSTSSKLTSSQVTHIIVSMMSAVGLDPNTHVVPDSANEDNNNLLASEEDIGEFLELEVEVAP